MRPTHFKGVDLSRANQGDRFRTRRGDIVCLERKTAPIYSCRIVYTVDSAIRRIRVNLSAAWGCGGAKLKPELYAPADLEALTLVAKINSHATDTP